MALQATIAVGNGILASGHHTGVTVTVYNPAATAVTVLGIQGYLFTSGTQQRAAGYIDGWALGPGMVVSVPAGGSLPVTGNCALFIGQPLATALGTVPTNEDNGGNSGGPNTGVLAYDVMAVVYTTGAGADAQVTTNRATVLYAGALPAYTGDGAWDTIKGAYPIPAAGPGQLWFDRVNGYNTGLECFLP